MKFTFRILVIAIFFLYIGGCAETQKQYKKYEPDEEFLAAKIKILQVHLIYSDFIAVRKSSIIKEQVVKILEKKGYKIDSISETMGDSYEDIKKIYAKNADAFVHVKAEMEHILQKPINLLVIYQIYIEKEKLYRIFYGPPPPWYSTSRESDPSKGLPYTENEIGFVNRVIENTFRNLPHAPE